jgi:dephospho-CoA kinase
VETLRHEATGPVVVWAIDAPARLRWQRIRSRGRPGDDLTWEEFVAQEQREQGSDPSTFHIARTMARADTTIQNDGTLDDLYRTVENLLSEAKKKKR